MTTPPLLDTHAWIWWIHEDTRLGRRTIEALDQFPADQRPAIADISLWEVATLVELGRLALPVPLDTWLVAAADPRTVRVLPVTPAVAVEVTRLPARFHRDPADRLIVATCRTLDYPLLTRDRAITRARLTRLWSPPVA
ncbi:MAG: type II toxin-antitoxin system VapC family toxin [Vicinamibacterales bacterium]